jgi:hypothetical protein
MARSFVSVSTARLSSIVRVFHSGNRMAPREFAGDSAMTNKRLPVRQALSDPPAATWAGRRPCPRPRDQMEGRSLTDAWQRADPKSPVEQCPLAGFGLVGSCNEFSLGSNASPPGFRQPVSP